MSYETRWKEISPEETIHKIKNFLRANDIYVLEINKINSGTCYAVTLLLKDTNLFVNGKGSTELFALASAYGELMERLSTLTIFRYHYRSCYRDFILLPNETLCHKNGYTEYIANYKDALRIQEYFTDYQEALIMEKYLKISDNTYEMLPLAIIDILYGTNGMSYGNTLNEAKIQAISEIFERFANREIVLRKLAPCRIENIEKIVNTKLYKIINEFKTDEYDFEILDAGLGMELPVVCLLFSHKKSGKYYVKFGSHFDINIAVERCFTELFQGRSIDRTDFLKEKFYFEDKEWINKNLISILHSGEGYYPLEFFHTDEPSYSPVRWKIFDSNDHALVYFEYLLKRISDKVYYADYSHHGHYIVKYLAKGVSEICAFPDIRIKSQMYLIKNAERLKSLIDCNVEEAEGLLNFVNTKNDAESLIPYLRHPVKRTGKYRFFNLAFLKLITAIKQENKEEIIRCLSLYEDCVDFGHIIEKIKTELKAINETGLKDFCARLLKLLLFDLFDFDLFLTNRFCEAGECYCNEIQENYSKMREIMNVRFDN